MLSLFLSLLVVLVAPPLAPASFAPAPPPPCVIKLANGTSIDLSPLTVRDGGAAYNVAAQPGSYNYTFNVCGPLPAGAPCASGDASACQTEGGAKVATLSRWDSTVQLGVGTDGAPQILSKNGDVCFPFTTPRVFTIQFLCAATEALQAFDQGCSYGVQFSTSLACVG